MSLFEVTSVVKKNLMGDIFFIKGDLKGPTMSHICLTMGCIWLENVIPNVTYYCCVWSILATYMSQYVTYMSNQMSHKGRHIFCYKVPLNVGCISLS